MRFKLITSSLLQLENWKAFGVEMCDRQCLGV